VGDPLTFIRAVHFAATLALAGTLVFGAAVAGPALRRTQDEDRTAVRARLLQLAWLGIAIALISSVAWFILLAAQTSERADALSGGTLWTVLQHTTVGHAWLVRLVPAALLAVALWRISPTDSGVSRWVVAAFLAVAYALAALETTQPASHVQPIWPFALRYSDAAFGDPQLREKLLFALWTIAGGAVLAAASVVVGLFMRRLRWWLIATGGGIALAGVIWVAPTLSVLAVEAYPTTFYVSPTGYSAASIVHGAELFTIHCASCHGRQGRGDGPAGRFFRVKPSDLTADHVYGHRDGDLYWWIVNGIGDVMPPSGAALDEDARWNVIDFVRANADAARLRDAPAKVTNVGYRAPDFSAACPDGSMVTRDNLRGRVAHLVIAGTGAVERLAQLAAPATPDLIRGSGQRGHSISARDVVTIAVPSESVPAGIACHTDTADFAAALAIYRGKDAGPSAGTEFLVDRSGALRAMWAPGRRPDWRDAEVLQREIAAIRDNPAAIRPTGSHLHERDRQ
jgi:mono/diheme cytochrome c family protein